MTFLFLFAHPDDESFSGAGTVMKYAARGVRSVLVTATRGERGTRGEPPVCAADELPAVRERELREAVAIIGFEELHLLDYVDRTLDTAPPQDIRRSLVSIIRRTRPSIVFTFDPNGANVHPDHVAISRFTSDAVSAARDPRWYPEAGDAHGVQRLLWTPPVMPWEAAERDGVEREGGVDFVLDVSPWRERKRAALRAHRTQQPSISRYFWERPDPGLILDREMWRQAWGPRPETLPAHDVIG